VVPADSDAGGQMTADRATGLEQFGGPNQELLWTPNYIATNTTNAQSMAANGDNMLRNISVPLCSKMRLDNEVALFLQ